MLENVKVIKHLPYCTKHNPYHPGTHDMDYDSYYCDICNRWLELVCSCNGKCEFSKKKRPEKPDIEGVEDENIMGDI